MKLTGYWAFIQLHRLHSRLSEEYFKDEMNLCNFNEYANGTIT